MITADYISESRKKRRLKSKKITVIKLKKSKETPLIQLLYIERISPKF